MFLSKLSIGRPVMITMALFVFLIFGALAYFGLPLNLMPDVEIPFITIQTVYPGANPQEIETQVTKKIEDAVSTVALIKEITSYSMESVSFVVIEFEMDKDVDIASQEVKDKIDAILNDLPNDAEKPITDKFEVGSHPIVELVLSGGESPLELYEFADKQLRDRFAQIQGVARVGIDGGQEREIRIEFDDRTVVQNRISLSQMAQYLAAANMDMPGGQYQQNDQEYAVRVEGTFESVEQLRATEVPTAFGMKRLEKLAEVRDTGAEVRQRSTYFNTHSGNRDDNVVRISLIKSSDGNAVEVSQSVKQELPVIEELLPGNMALNIVDDNSLFIQSSVEDTISNILLGILFTGFILLLFLHDLRSTFIVAVAMPTSIISTFLVMQVSDFTLNVLSLMGLSTSVGVLVTNSVVVLENIFRHKRLGENRKGAADVGTSEIAVAVVASTMTNIVVFLPIASMTSIAGRFFTEFALTVTYATIFSLIISFTLTPMLASLILPHQMKKKAFGRWFDRVFDGFENLYKGLLRAIFRHRIRSALVLVIAVVALVLTMQIMVNGLVGFEFMPALDEGNIQVQVELDTGDNLEETADALRRIEDIISKHEEVKHILVTLGKLGDTDIGTNLARANVKLVDAEERTLTTNQVNDLLIMDLKDIPDARIKVSVQSSAGGGPDAPISFSLVGQEMDQIAPYDNQIRKITRDVPGLINFDSSMRTGKPEISIYPKRKEMAEAGATVYDVAMTVRAAVEGMVATHYREQGEEYDIKITLNNESVDSREKIMRLPVATPAGMYRLSHLAEVRYTDGVNKIIHKDKFVSIDFSGDVSAGVSLSDVTAGVRNRLDELNLPPGTRIVWGGDTRMMEETTADMARTFLLAIILTYMLLAAILESFIQPFLILLTLPLALIGVILALYLTGQTMNMFSMMAIIMLVGIVVNNAILLLDYTNQLRRKGMNPGEALIEACPTKLKPIIMSSLAIILGMLPMALGIGSAGKEFRQAMGIVSIGGLVVSTFLTLVVIPAFYHLVSRKHHQ